MAVAEVRFEADLKHVCRKHDMTLQHVVSSLPAGSLRSGDRRGTPPERQCRTTSRSASSRSLCAPSASWAPRLRCRAQRGDAKARTARAIFSCRPAGQRGGLPYQPAPPVPRRRQGPRGELERDDDRRGGSSVALRCARGAPGRVGPVARRLSNLRSTRSRIRVAARRLGLALGTAGVAVERDSSSRWGQRSRNSSCDAQRRFSGLSTGRRRSRRSGKPTRSHGPDNCRASQRGGAALDSFRSVDQHGRR